MKISIVLAAMTGSFETDMNRASKTAQKQMREIEKAAVQVGKAVGAAMVVAAGAIAAGLKMAIDRADEMSKAAQKIGISTEALSTLAYAANLAGVEMGELQAGLNRLTKFQADAAAGTERNIELFTRLGVAYQNADGSLRDAGAVFRDLADRLSKMPEGADRAAIAIEAFGRSGANLLPMLNQGADGIAELEERARRLGLELGTAAGKQAEELNDRLSDLWSVVDGLALTVATDLLPDIIALTESLTGAIREGGGMVEVGRDIADIFRGLAKVFKAADLAIEGMGERFNIAAQYKNMFLDPLGWETYQAEIEKSTQRLRELEEETRKLALAARQDFGIDPKIIWIDPPPPPASGGRRRGTPMQDGENVVITPTGSQRDQWGADLEQAASKAAAEAARAARDAAREQEEQIRRAEAAQASFLTATQDLRAELEGPFAQIQLDYIRREDELIELANLAGLSQEELASSLGFLEQARLRDVAATQAQIDAQKAYDKALKDAPLIDQMDALRETTSGFFVDLVKNGQDAIDRLADYLYTSALQGIGKMIAEQMFGAMGTAGGGMLGGSGDGGGWAAALGSLFGGARAGGGDIWPGQAFLVGEEGPELVLPKSAGTVVPAGKTAAMLGGRGRGGDTYVIQGATSRRATERIRMDRNRADRKAVAEMS